MLGALLLRSLLHEISGHFRAAAIITLGAGTLFGVLDEWHQSFTGRTPDLADALADLAGLALGVIALVWLRRRRQPDGG